MRPVKTTMRKQSGIALITTMLLLLLMSAMVVGFMLLVTEGQRLSGMDRDQIRAFYGAESGMEKLTADLGALFGTTYAPSGAQVNAIATAPPVLPSSSGVSYVDVLGNSTYNITFPTDGKGNPQAQFAQITSGSSAFQGMTALETTYTMTVAARTNTGGEAKLVRTTQTVGIPLFQFGIYSETDLSFFPGPNFNFGGRVHTNGNLFLNSGGPAGATPTQTTTTQLWLASPVTVAKDIFRDCLSNTHPESATAQHPGSVEITKGGGTYQALGFGQGSLTSCLGTPKNPSWPGISASFNGNLRSGVKPLNLTITLLGNGATQPIDIIRRPIPGENTTNPGVLGERYFSEASLKILLSDTAADITGLPCVSATPPFNLALLAIPAANWDLTNASIVTLLANMNAAVPKTIPLPLAASGAASTVATGAAGNYNQGSVPGNITGGDGYWQVGPTQTATSPTYGTPIVTGFIKIDAQTSYGSPCGTWKDVTLEILGLGYVGKNINPLPQSYDGNNLSPNWGGTAALMQGASTRGAPLGPTPPLPTTPAVDPNTGGTVQLIYQNAPPFPTTTPPNTIFTSALFNTKTCPEPHPNAVIRLERIRDNPTSVNVQIGARKTTVPTNLPVQSTIAEVCGIQPDVAIPTLAKLRTGPTALPATGATWVPDPFDFWPNTIFDTREGYNRQAAPTGTYTVGAATPNYSNTVTLGGVMNYIELDVNNLARWFSGAIGSSGLLTEDPNVAPNNFVVYISDRRSNYVFPGTIAGTWPPVSPSGKETGEYGWGDFVNPSTIGGCPNASLDTGEDLDGTGVLYTYGGQTFPRSATAGLSMVDRLNTLTYVFDTLFQSTGAASAGNSLFAVTPDPLCPTANGGSPWPRSFLKVTNEARENPPSLFRRAVKLVNGKSINLPLCPGGLSCGLTIAAENPAYLQGDYNANGAGNGFADPSIAASVVADAFTLLSDDWNDFNSFNSPFNVNGRVSNTVNDYYRLGVVAGKGLSFPIPSWDSTTIDGSQDFGTDGGVHNFMRFLENHNGTLNYQGSIVSLYYNRQGVGLFNSGGNNYSPPNRGYQFDSNFLNPLLLPPRTPMFRDVNTTGFTQLLLPNQ